MARLREWDWYAATWEPRSAGYALARVVVFGFMGVACLIAGAVFASGVGAIGLLSFFATAWWGWKWRRALRRP